MAEIGFRLLQSSHVEEHARLADLVVRTEPPMPPGDAVTIAAGFLSNTLCP